MVRGDKGPVPFKPAKFQTEIVKKIFDSGQVTLAGIQICRGNGKTTFCAALALWDLFCGAYASNIVCCATDERQAALLFDAAVWMVENSPELAARAQIYRDRIEVPGQASTLRMLPAVASSLEGLQYTTAFLDEAAWASSEVYETLLDALGKYRQGRLILLGTPSPHQDRPLYRVREYAREAVDDPTVAWIEHSADDFQSHAWDCQHCLALANPALGKFLHQSGVSASRPPKAQESRWRMMRLGQWITGGENAYLDRASWDACEDTHRRILPGTDVVLAFDGSRSGDACALVAVSVVPVPIVELVKIWQPALEVNGYRVPILDVEETIRQAADLYNVREIAADPYLWERSLQILADEGYPVAIFPNRNERMVPAVAAFREAVVSGEVTHTGDPILTAHVMNAITKDVDRGFTVTKQSPKSPNKIDALICALMGHSRARHYQGLQPTSNELYVF